jgi:hypothetical protein
MMDAIKTTGRKMDAAWKKAISEGKRHASGIGAVAGMVGAPLVTNALLNRAIKKNINKSITFVPKPFKDKGLISKRIKSIPAKMDRLISANPKQMPAIANKATRVAKALIAKQDAIDRKVFSTGLASAAGARKRAVSLANVAALRGIKHATPLAVASLGLIAGAFTGDAIQRS